jgi:transglutaminase-like putative cysteine protease
LLFGREAYLGETSIGVQCWEGRLRFHLSLLNAVTNTSGVRLVGGKLDVAIAAPSAGQSSRVLRASPSPHIEARSEGNTRALVKIPELNPEQTFESRIETEVTTSKLNFQLDRAAHSSRQSDEYCRRAKFWETSDPVIRRTAEKIRHSSQDIHGFLANTFAWVRDNVKLREPQATRLGAARAIRELTGDCDELSDLFITLCRAEMVPCRRVVGLFYRGDEVEERPFEWHAWAEVQTSGGMWIPFDPSLGFFASISERHIARCCMGRRSDYPVRSLTWRSPPVKSPALNDEDVERIAVLSS